MPIPKVDFSKPQDCWSLPVVFPAERGGVVDVKNGPRGRARIVSHVSTKSMERNEVVARVCKVPSEIDWIEEDIFDALCAVSASGEELIFRHKVHEQEAKRLRVPVFIQDENYPVCCGRSMVFVGQIDDDRLCTEPPPDAKRWWHDRASFYVYTCCICLDCKATGQQF